MLQVPQAFLRRLDELAVVSPARSAGGRRRDSRRQIARVLRARALTCEGLTLAGARRVLALEERISRLEADLDAASAEATRLRRELAATRAGRHRCVTDGVEGGNR
jgi:MerR family transcriptional regulator, heat shock protein HspR